MKLTLPDKSIRELPEGSSGYDLAKDIGAGLAKAAIAISVDGKKQDLNDVIHMKIALFQLSLLNLKMV
tara:strand:+ start:42 stop:245 length:204 start_codon:yes stop_codon:yes gene_type:complete